MITIIVERKELTATFETQEHINLHNLLEIIVCAMQADGWTYVKALKVSKEAVDFDGDEQ